MRKSGSLDGPPASTGRVSEPGAPRRQVTYSVTESEEDVSESPDAFVVELTRSDNFWTQRVRWYPDDCFGPYRAERLGYSRRELCADAVVHLVGIVAFSAGAGALLHACCVHEPPVETTVSLLLYVCSLSFSVRLAILYTGVYTQVLTVAPPETHTGR